MSIVRLLINWNPNTRHIEYKYRKVIRSEGIFVANKFMYNYTSRHATEKQWLRQEKKDKLIEEQKYYYKPLKKGEQVVNPWKRSNEVKRRRLE